MLTKLRSHLILATTFFILTLAQQYGFYAYKALPIVGFTFVKYFAIFAFLLTCTFARGHKTRFFFLSFILLLNFFQMAHLSYFGTQVLPSEIWLLFAEFHEIQGTLKEEWHHVFMPLLFVIIPLLISFFISKKIKLTQGSRIVTALLCLYLVYNPIRTFVTGNTWGRQPSTHELAGMNIYLASSYFLGKILPHKLSQSQNLEAKNQSLALELSPEKDSPWDKVIVVMGESLSPHHMGLFNYPINTTPTLSLLKHDPNFTYSQSLSSGVSTDISVAFFLNMGYGAAGSLKAAKGHHCLFKLAKKQKFSTHFISIQSAQQLRYIAPYLCSASLDDYRSLENISPATVDHQAALDRDLLPSLKDLLSSPEKKFIILHQRGSHAPWNLRFTKEATKFSGRDVDQRINDYDNSVFEFDLFWKELSTMLKAQTQKVLVIYFSDHGESLGVQGKWGHGFLDRSSFEVPVMIQSFNQELPELAKKLPPYFTQYNLSLFISHELGFKSNQAPETLPNDYVILGNDIDGFAGKAQIHFKPEGGYDFKVLP